MFDKIVERQVAEGRAKGAFDDLALSGKPIPDLHINRPQGWWAAGFVRTERAKLRRDELREQVSLSRRAFRSAASTSEVQRLVDEINAEIEEHNRVCERIDLDPMPLVDIDEALRIHERGRPGATERAPKKGRWY